MYVCVEKEGMVITIAKKPFLLKQERLFSVIVIGNGCQTQLADLGMA
jgi:hypothetical protein